MKKVSNSSLKNKPFGYVERFIEPCILLFLSKSSFHGYGLMEDLEKHCGEKVDIGNLYRTLRKMEKIGWVRSHWEKGKDGPKKRTYKITQKGKNVLKNAFMNLKRTQQIISRFFAGYKNILGGT